MKTTEGTSIGKQLFVLSEDSPCMLHNGWTICGLLKLDSFVNTGLAEYKEWHTNAPRKPPTTKFL